MKKDFYGVPKARTDSIVVSEVRDELLLYCLKTHKAYCLNQTAAAVYQSVDGVKTTTEIAAVISKELKSDVTEDFVLFTLGELKSQNLVEFSNANGITEHLTSRREAIKKIGLSTAVGLPIITMLVAPRATHAQSCINDGETGCTNGGAGPIFTQGTCCPGLICCPSSLCVSTACLV